MNCLCTYMLGNKYILYLSDPYLVAEMEGRISTVAWMVSKIQKPKDVLNKADAVLGSCRHFVQLNGDLLLCFFSAVGVVHYLI